MQILLLNYACTLMMTGLIWFVQIVHYPLFSAVGQSGFSSYERAHSRLTSVVVVPLMLLELATAIYLVLRPPSADSGALLWLAFVLVGAAWASTFILQVPQHQMLGNGFDPAAHKTLVVTNWVRTAAWSFRSILLTIILLRSVGGPS